MGLGTHEALHHPEHKHFATMQQKQRPPRPSKIIIKRYEECPLSPEKIIAYPDNGLRLVLITTNVKPEYQTFGRLYVDNKRHFFSLTKNRLRQVWENYPPARRTLGRLCHNGKRGNQYPIMPHFGAIQCHVFVCTAFHGPRPVFTDGKRAECDHKNGNPLDYTAENLEWVHPDENHWRSVHVLRVLRKHSINPADYTGSQMDYWFKVMRHLDATNPNHSKVFTADDYIGCYTICSLGEDLFSNFNF